MLIAVPVHLVSVAQWTHALDTARWNLTQANDTNAALVFLTDFQDSLLPGDTVAERELLAYALEQLNDGVRDLAGRPILVHLLHRDRTFVAAENCWMGKERKRGKLAQLNRLLLNGDNAYSSSSDNALSFCQRSRYVLCLDEDSRLARNSLQSMAGFLEHPLNVPRLKDGKVCHGHGLAVPCTMTDASSLSSWRWPKFTVGPSMSPRGKFGSRRNFMYDWFGQAPFSGKGMYLPSNFERLCNGRIPNGMVLSHDTLEAAWLRPGYVDRALVTDAYPASFRSFIERQDRWVRGDLQNAAILLSQSRQKSQRAPVITYFTVGYQLYAWMSNAVVFAAFALIIAFNLPLPWYLGVLSAMMLGGYQRLIVNAYRDRSLPLFEKIRIYAPYYLRIHLAQLVRLAASPIYALVFARACILTTWRMTTRKRLLQWRSAAIADADRSQVGLFLALSGLISALAAVTLILKLLNDSGAPAIFVLAIWMSGVFLNRFLSRNA